MKSLVFSNADAKTKNVTIYTTAECAESIIVWYAAYHAGDRYTVTLDGRNVPIDHNGEPK